MPLTILARITAKSGHETLVEEELKKLIDLTRKEDGCLQYDLHQDNEAPGHFVFYETWENRDLWQQHMSAPHLAQYMNATEGAVEEFTLNEMRRVA